MPSEASNQEAHWLSVQKIHWLLWENRPHKAGSLLPGSDSSGDKTKLGIFANLDWTG